MRFVSCVAVVALALEGCGVSCTLMYAPSTVTVEIDQGDVAPGLYEVELSGYGEVAMCTVTLPADDATVVSCTDFASLELDEAGERIVAFVATEFDPESFTARVLLDGQIVAEEEFAPDYRVDEPNGPGCGERSVATVSLSF